MKILSGMEVSSLLEFIEKACNFLVKSMTWHKSQKFIDW